MASNTETHFNLTQHLFPKQDKFGLSKARQRTACCSRRAGKSEACAGILIDTALKRKGCVALYLTKTRLNAKRILWGTLKRVNLDYALGGTPSEAELCMRFPNGSVVYLAGANNRDEIEKFRGLPIGVVVVDESQILVGYLQQLIDEVLAPALMDYDGMLVLVGTPAPVPSGYFYDCIYGVAKEAWEHYQWTVFDNPWIKKKSGKTPQQHLEAELKRRGVTVDDPVIQREWFGRWVHDPNSLVFRYESAANDFTGLPDVTAGDWECVLGVDFGHDDADAIGVLEWNTTLPDLWLTEEHVMPKQNITKLGDKLKQMVDTYQPLAVVVDTGALGKKIAAELTDRWSLQIEAAEKERKLEHIELLNDAMRTGVFHASKDSRFAQDCMLVEWDKSKPEKPKISERYHSDICDAVLYGYRKAKQWLSTPEPDALPAYGTQAWLQRNAERLQGEEQRLYEEALRETAVRERERKDEEADWDFA